MHEIKNAIKQICDEKNLAYETVVATIESALAAAYRKDFGQKNQNIKITLNEDDIAKSEVFDVKLVVEDFTEEELARLEEKSDESTYKTEEDEDEKNSTQKQKFN